MGGPRQHPTLQPRRREHHSRQEPLLTLLSEFQNNKEQRENTEPKRQVSEGTPGVLNPLRPSFPPSFLPTDEPATS